jgi:hypothetical protein
MSNNLDELATTLYNILKYEIDREVESNNIIHNFKHTIILKLVNKLLYDTELKMCDNESIQINKQMCCYIPETNYYKILNKETMNLTKHSPDNLFDIDIEFIKQGYNLTHYTDKAIVDYVIKNDYINHIFHPKQLYNLFNNKIKILMNKENKYIYVDYNNNSYMLCEFIKYINSYSYDFYKNLTITLLENKHLKDNNLLILVYIGSDKNLNFILKKIKKYYEIQNFSLAFCINYKLVEVIIPLITNEFDTNYIIYSSSEMGNDIIPSLLVYDKLIQRDYNFDYIIKIHTKTDLKFLINALEYLLKDNLNNLLLKKNDDSSSIGFKYIKEKEDIFNKKLYAKFDDLLNYNQFVAGTMFLTNNKVFEKVLKFLKDNYQTIFFQNMYDNNSINKNCSYVHFIERLFGYV